MELRCGDCKERMTTRSFHTLELLMSHPGQVFSAERILDRVWGQESDVDLPVVFVNISQLRKKLNELGSDLEIRVIRGSGYVLEVRS